MESFVVRAWLPDRPGALGQVASRIGAVGGDVVGIDILERGGGRAIDELVVSVPDDAVLDLLVAEITQVDGVAVEDVRRVAAERPEPGVLALELAARLVASEAGLRLDLLCHEMIDLVDGDWAVAFRVGASQPVVSVRTPPDPVWLGAFLAGAAHLSDADQLASAPGDLAWSWLSNHDLAVAVGRADRPFHTRERTHVALLGRIADSLDL